jgi:hypothetical protein
VALCGILGLVLGGGCVDAQDGSPAGSGGATAEGGATSTTSSGGISASGGTVGTGGSAASSGGSTTSRATGGSTSGGSVGRGGSMVTGGSVGNGGTTGSGGASPGTTSSGGTTVMTAAGGRIGSGGTGGSAAGGRTGTGGGGTTASGGTGDPAIGGTGGGTTASGGTTGACGSPTQNQHPFGCTFAWGIANPGGSLASYSYLQLVSYWVDSSITASGTYSSCGACNWLKNSVASTNLIPAYYAYIIGFYGHANGLVDGNQSGSKKLTTDGAALIKANRQTIINAYAWYAKQTAQAWPSKPLVWLLEGDFVQYTGTSQSSPLTYAELGQLAADITCAIKSNMPNAVVAIDHSSWNADDVTKSFWDAMKNVNYDMVWTTGVGNNQGYIASGTTGTTYNAKTATYSYLHSTTGRTILVDTSAGASAAGDSWSTASASELNARIAEGVIAANITGTAPNGLQSNISKLTGLSAIPSCP